MFKFTDEYKEFIERVLFFRRSYGGGYAYREGRYLLRHERESETAYKRRLQEATFTNFCGPIIDAYISYLYRDDPTREVDQFDESIITNIDMMGRDIGAYMRYIARVSGTESTVGIIVDKPSGTHTTRAQELSAGVRPYCVTYKADEVVNPPKYRIENGVPIMERVVLKDGTSGEFKYFKVWLEDGWERWEQKGNAKPRLIDSGEHGLGVVPFISAKNRDTGNQFAGLSDIADISDINRKVYILESNSLAIIEGTAFPMLEAPEGGDIQGGEGNILTYDPDTSAKHQWIEPTGNSLKEIRADRAAYIEDIWRLSKLGPSEANKVSEGSGVALELRFQQLNALLSEKAESMENVERAIFDLMAKWDGGEFTGLIEYPRRFGIRDLSSDLDTAIKASTLIQSRTFTREMAVKLATRLLATEDQDIINQIETELTGINMMDALNA